MSVTGPAARVMFDPPSRRGARQFAIRGLRTLFDGGDHLLFLACLLLPIRRARSLFALIAAVMLGQARGGCRLGHPAADERGLDRRRGHGGGVGDRDRIGARCRPRKAAMDDPGRAGVRRAERIPARPDRRLDGAIRRRSFTRGDVHLRRRDPDRRALAGVRWCGRFAGGWTNAVSPSLSWRSSAWSWWRTRPCTASWTVRTSSVRAHRSKASRCCIRLTLAWIGVILLAAASNAVAGAPVGENRV